MTQKQIKDQYWSQFVQWCESERNGIDDNDEMEAISIELNTKPTDENFWDWYMENIG